VEFSVATLLNRIAADDFELTPASSRCSATQTPGASSRLSSSSRGVARSATSVGRATRLSLSGPRRWSWTSRPPRTGPNPTRRPR